jgi:acyl carrier protein
LPDGNLEFIDRIDGQVKLRGFRTELGEIEAVLKQHAGVRDAVVAVRDEPTWDRRLVAYIVPAFQRGRGERGLSHHQPNDEDIPAPTGAGFHEDLVPKLREFLRQQLPEYMVPSAFVLLDAVPLTTSGKVDRAALPAPSSSRPSVREAFVAPRTDVEATLAAIGAELLGVDRISVYDSFFNLGGHSLMATRFVSRIRSEFEIDLPLRVVFEKPTIAELAVAVVQQRAAQVADSALTELLGEIEHMSEDTAKSILAARQGLSGKEHSDA